MTNEREKEFSALVVELQRRYQDISGPKRFILLMTTTVAIGDSFCSRFTKKFMTEDEFVTLARQVFQKLRREEAAN